MKIQTQNDVSIADNSNVNVDKSIKHIAYLDYLRSFAIIMVVILHVISDYIIVPELYGTKAWYVNIVSNAFVRTGVPIFFMISGYLILSSKSTLDFRYFYKKRFLRILIPLTIWNILYYAYQAVYGYVTATGGFSIFSFCAAVLNFGTKYHLWYLYTTLGLYMVAPFLKIVIDHCNMKQLGLLLGIMMLCTSIIPFVNFLFNVQIYLFEPLFNGYIGCFLLGYILGKIELNKRRIYLFNFAALISFVISVALNHIYSSAEGINLVMNHGYNPCHFIIASTIFIDAKYFVAENNRCNKAASFMSKMSFGIYLVHPLVLDLTKLYVLPDLSPILSMAFISVIVFGVSLILSFIYYRCISVGEIFMKKRG